MQKRLTPATVLATVALFVSLAGTATATTAVLITGAQIKDGTIGVRDLSKKTRLALRGPRGFTGLEGAPGAPGVPGPAGATGPAGGFDPSKLHHVTGPPHWFGPGDTEYVRAECPPGDKVIGGGYWSNAMLVINEETYGPAAWQVLIHNDSEIEIRAQAWAMCVAP
jgi:hypothetical protein